MKRSSVFAIAPLAILGFGFGSGIAAQARPAEVPSQSPPVFGEEMDVRVVNVEAVVTDRQGNRVTGLKPGDFRLRVDGKQVPVDYFSEVKEGRVLAPAAEPGEKPAAQPEAPVQQVAEGKVGTYYLVFIDDYFTVGPQRDQVLKGLKADLAKLNPEDRMAIVAYDGGRLAMISNWSGSAADLGAALDRAAQRTAHGFERRTEEARFKSDQGFSNQTVGDNAQSLNPRSPAGGGDGNPLDLNSRAPALTGTQSAYGSQLIAQIRADVQAAVSAMRAFSAPQGRKVMLLLSGGWPFSVRNYITGGQVMPSHDMPEGEQVLAPLTRTANLLGYTLYPVDVPGVQTAAADVGADSPAGIDSGGEQEIEGSLYFLAQQTGGKALVNSNRIVALSGASADTRSFYWLGFTPDWKRNDKPHDIKLEALRPGLRVRSRTGFLDLSRKAEVSMKVESALLFGGLPGGTAMPMKVGEIKRNRRGELEVPLTLGLPVDLMTVVPINGKYNAQLELRFAASNSDGSASEIPVVPVNLASDHPPTAGKVVKYTTSVTLHGKADHLVVAAYDPLSGKLASAETDVKAP
jgi:VWFA-related protein